MKSLSSVVVKLWPRLELGTEGQGKKIIDNISHLSVERVSLVEYAYQI